ncbi:MAG: hypothetical protein JWN29_142 [Acidimicrobiales bacterium]|nr:hypothetical protein [Acidimicrobiales bacterium]
MRRFAAPCFVLAVAVVLAACSSGGSSLSVADARKVATKAQLTAADLGSGWTKTADEKPSDAGSQDKELLKCLGAESSPADDSLAESNTRTFERSVSEVDQQQVVVSSAVLVSKDKADELFRIVATKKFAECITKVFEDQMKATAEDVTYESGAAQVARAPVKAADHSVQITVPFTFRSDPVTFDGQVDLALVTTDQAISLLFGFSLGEPIGQDQLGHLTDLLAARQKV